MKKLVVVVASIVLLALPRPSVGASFVRGDPNGDGTLDLSDGVKVLGVLFVGEASPECREALDANDDAAVDLSDGIYILSFLFTGGRPPPAPYPDCGQDATPDDLGCTSFSPCPDCVDPAQVAGLIQGEIDLQVCSPTDQVFDAGIATVTVCPAAKAVPCGDPAAPGCTITVDKVEPRLDLAGKKATIHVEGSAKAFPVLVKDNIFGSETNCSNDITFSGDVVVGLVLDPPEGGRVRLADILDPTIENPVVDLTSSGGLICTVLETQKQTLIDAMVPLLLSSMQEVIATARPQVVGTYICQP